MSLIGRFEHLPKRPKSDEALPLLEKIASQVKPIMSKRGWKVGTLAEFLPSNPALLGNNMNAGQRINLRLRPPGDITSFYEYDQLVLVMLHELTHIEHGPHDAQFYKLLAQLEEEYYDLKRKGYSGEGFHGSGNHLSGFKVPEYVGKEKGMLAAQKRLDVQKKIGKGGVLGGSGTDYRNRSMKEVLAEAAERRMRDDKSCQSQHAGHAKEVEEEVRKAMEESEGVDAVDLPDAPLKTEDCTGAERDSSPEIQILDAPSIAPSSAKTANTPTAIGTAGTKRKQYSASTSTATPKPPTVQSKRQSPSLPAHSRSTPSTPTLPPGEWSCETCTLINNAQAKSCDACATPRPAPIEHIGRVGPEGWYCDFCGAGPRDMSFWSCIECGWVRKWG